MSFPLQPPYLGNHLFRELKLRLNSSDSFSLRHRVRDRREFFVWLICERPISKVNVRDGVRQFTGQVIHAAEVGKECVARRKECFFSAHRFGLVAM